MNKPSIRVFLVEDHQITRFGIKKMLEAVDGVEIIGDCASGLEALNYAKANAPDIMIIDLGLEDISGIELAKLIKENLSTRIIVFASNESKNCVIDALKAGIDAYCLKDLNQEQLADAVRSVSNGAVWLDAKVARIFTDCLAQNEKPEIGILQPKIKRPFSLSEREYEILCLLVEGNSNQKMAEKLFLSAETIKTHMRHLMEKLEVADRTQAAVKAVKEGLIPQPA